MYKSFLEKIGVLATSCRRKGAKNDAKRQKNRVKMPKPAQKQRKNSPKPLVVFFCRRCLFFSRYCIHIHICPLGNSVLLVT